MKIDSARQIRIPIWHDFLVCYDRLTRQTKASFPNFASELDHVSKFGLSSSAARQGKRSEGA